MSKSEFQQRITKLIAILAVGVVVLGIRLLDVQGINSGDYSSRAENELYLSSTLLAPRGEITDINGIAFARSVSRINIVVDQKMIANPEATAAIAGPILNMSQSDVLSIDDYLVRCRPALLKKLNEGALFLNARGTRLSRVSAWEIVKKAANKSGLTARVTPHIFRHSYATHLLDGGADIRVVQELLGHASVTTTQIYTLITIDKVRESYRLAHPRA